MCWGIDHPHLEMAFEQVEHRLPKHPRRLHRHMRHLQLGQPLAQLHKIRRHRAELAQRALHRAILRIKDAHTRHHQFLMHVQSARPRIQRPQPRNATLLLAHRRSPFRRRAQGTSGLFDSPSRALVGRQRGDNLRRRRMSRITLRVGLSRATHLSISSLGHRSLIISLLSHFHLLWASVSS
jgi:hypothetical protein